MQSKYARTFTLLNKGTYPLSLKSPPLKGLDMLVLSTVTQSKALKGLSLPKAFTYTQSTLQNTAEG